MKKNVSLAMLLILVSAFCFQKNLDKLVADSFAIAQKQFSGAITSHTDTDRFPRSSKPDGSLNAVRSDDWTSGFFPGNLWYMYDYTKDAKWKNEAEKWTAGLEKEKYNKSTHDLGFMLFCSFGNGYRLTKNEKYKEIILEGSRSLMSRFKPQTGCIQSWGSSKKWQFPVIIDNMMNLEMLFWATKVSGDSSFYKVAVTHANTTLKNHFRSDNSSYHVLNYDTLTGEVISKVTAQGYADESAWARGQAWGLYGYTVCYRETKDKRYLEQAKKIADFYLSNPTMPKDKVPYWDFNAPNIPNESRDAAAAAIACSGLMELSGFAGKEGARYKQAALQILESLASPAYLAKVGTNNHFLLMHATGHRPEKSEIDVPLVYADYYFLESLLRSKRMLAAR